MFPQYVFKKTSGWWAYITLVNIYLIHDLHGNPSDPCKHDYGDFGNVFQSFDDFRDDNNDCYLYIFKFHHNSIQYQMIFNITQQW